MKWYNEIGMTIVGSYFLIAFIWACAILLDDSTEADYRIAAWIIIFLVFVTGAVLWALP